MKIAVLFLLLLPITGFTQAVEKHTRRSQAAHAGPGKNDGGSTAEYIKLQQLREDLRLTGIPSLDVGDRLIFHAAYALVYSEEHEQAKWVAHIILPDVITGNVGRSNSFRPDTLVETGSAVEQDYFVRVQQADGRFKYEGLGYDRGHLAPSADFRYSKQALSESYLYSNMSPQAAQLNRGRWAEMEDLVRQYVFRNNLQLYVVTGGVLRPGLKKIERGRNQVSIPEHYFKVMLDPVNKKGIGFIMPNKACDYPVMTYACSIDSVESITGIDFFAALPNEEEKAIESSFDISKWVGEQEQGDVKPLRMEDLPRNAFNTDQAQLYRNRNEAVKVCGTVVSTRLSATGNIFLNIDKKFPNQVFSIAISKENVRKFSYDPGTYLAGKAICVTGKITNSNAVATMNVLNESAVEVDANK